MGLLSELKGFKGARKSRKRVGRGDASGHGGTSCKGHKGQKARSGGKVRRAFEGGQTPLMRRLPKFGFTNVKFETRYNIVSLDQLNQIDGDEVTSESLRNAGIISRRWPVKILANGKISRALTVKVERVSAGAKSAIETAGGKVEVIG